MRIERSSPLALCCLVLAAGACGGSSNDSTIPASDAGGADGWAPWTGAGGGGGDGGGGGGYSGGSGYDGAADAETGVSNGSLGAACTATSECAAGLTCVPPTGSMIPGGGPAHGMCTVQCGASDDCSAFGGRCVSLSSSSSWCAQTCTIGGAPATKCQGRMDQACEGRYDNNNNLIYAACVPMCASDADCGSRKCDAASGMCVDGVPSYPPLGTPCNRNDTNDPCTAQSLCLYGACVELCRFGSFDACGYRRTAVDAMAGTVGACFQPIDDPVNGNAGDLGFCWQLCDVAADCLVPGWICDLSFKAEWGHGICNSPPRDGGVDAASD